MPSTQGPLQTLIHSSLGVQSLLKKQPLKHNVIERDKVVLPPNWDSWGKIRVLREGFDVEGVNQGWSIDIEEILATNNANEPNLQDQLQEQTNDKPIGAVILYEEMVRDPGIDLSAPRGGTNGLNLEVQHLDAQGFLASQLEVLDRIRLAAEPSGTEKRREASDRNNSLSQVDTGDRTNLLEAGRVAEHIGPVQFNMGGIQVDADDMLQRLKVFSFIARFATPADILLGSPKS
jgi:dynein light intermediate chain 1, cytosolic